MFYTSFYERFSVQIEKFIFNGLVTMLLHEHVIKTSRARKYK